MSPASTPPRHLDVRRHVDRPLHGHPRQPRRLHRPARHPRRPRRGHRVAAVDGQRLHARLRRVPPDRRGARRPLRPQAHLRPRRRAVRRRLRRRGARAHRRRADRRPRPPGPRRRVRHAALADAALRRRPGGAARPGDRRAGPACPASASRSGPVVGGAIVDGLSWHWIFWVNVPIALVLIPLAHARPHREPRPERRARPARPRARRHRPARPDLRHRARRRARLGQPASSLGTIGHGHRPADAVPALGGARAAADAAAALLPQPHVLGDERRVVRDVLRRLRLDLLPLAVLPDGGGAARRSSRACAILPWTAMPIVVAPIAGHPQRPDRRASADGGRPRAAGAGHRLARRRCSRSASRTRRSSRRSSPAAPAWRSCSRRRRTPSSARSARARSGRRRARRTRSASSAACSASRSWRRVFSSAGGYESPQAFVDGVTAALPIGAARPGRRGAHRAARARRCERARRPQDGDARAARCRASRPPPEASGTPPRHRGPEGATLRPVSSFTAKNLGGHQGGARPAQRELPRSGERDPAEPRRSRADRLRRAVGAAGARRRPRPDEARAHPVRRLGVRDRGRGRRRGRP